MTSGEVKSDSNGDFLVLTQTLQNFTFYIGATPPFVEQSPAVVRVDVQINPVLIDGIINKAPFFFENLEPSVVEIDFGAISEEQEKETSI